eukprot:NODE_2342_length_1608_cov_201.007407_g2012_i0.p1 GENE.NODE_2342_length_1608_cov_201.007407_g2012_i0~~NODE_2342_length_1608_cov_201.007407_g2012_i0.p1  ORF type:complete len:470 (-),score=65.64 NODE_2342_length_1608_cov_201.007407_g2012_i0:135-1544(-)
MSSDDTTGRKRCFSYGMSDDDDTTNTSKKPKRDESRESSDDSDTSESSSEKSVKPKKTKKKSQQKAEVKKKETKTEKEVEKPQTKEKEKEKEKKYYTPKQSSEEGHYHVVCGENMTERYKILDLMGQGTFAKVIEAWDRKELKRYAVKIVRATKKYTKDAQFELEILERVKRKDREDRYCTVKVQGTMMYHDPRSGLDHLCIFFPKLGPSLLDFINKNATFTLAGIAQMTKHICEALDFLHNEMHLIHTDLKPENILLTESGYTHEGRRRVPRKYNVRIIDFGGATDEDHSDYSIVSTRHYRAPEVIVGSGWMYPADIWSVGCILIELYTGDVLFDTHENREHLALMEKILGPFPDWFSRKVCDSSRKYFRSDGKLRWPEMASSEKSVAKVERTKPIEMLSSDSDFIDLLHKMLDYDKKRRLTAREVLSHPFIVKHTTSRSSSSPQTASRRGSELASRDSSNGRKRSKS